MKKILILYPAHWEQSNGGAELQIKYLTEGALKSNYILYFIFEDNGTSIIKSDKIILYPLKRIKLSGKLGVRWVLYNKQILVRIKEIKPDVIYTRHGSAWAGIAANYAIQNGIKHIHSVASDYDVKGKFRALTSLLPLNVVDNFMLKYAYKHASILITQNKYQRIVLQDQFKRTSIQIKQMTPIVKEEALIEKDNHCLQILWIGNLKSCKRPWLFLKLAELLSNEHCDCKMIIAGRISMKYQAEILNTTSKYPILEYRGELTQEAVFKLMNESHLLINTSKYEGFSNTFVQAWMRKMVVISMASNPDGVLTKNGIGYVCPTILEVKDRIIFLFNNSDVMQKMASKSYCYAKRNHSLENNSKEVVQIFEY